MDFWIWSIEPTPWFNRFRTNTSISRHLNYTKSILFISRFHSLLWFCLVVSILFPIFAAKSQYIVNYWNSESRTMLASIMPSRDNYGWKHMDTKEIGIIIKERRKHLGVNQQTLADLASIGLNTLVAIERGNGNPQLSTLLTILDTLGLQMDIKLKTLDYETV